MCIRDSPTTKTQLRSFLGTCNVYRRFVEKFAFVAAPLTQLLKKGQGDNLPALTPEQTRAFESLRQAMLSPPILRLPREGHPYVLDTDASQGQIGCALLQLDADEDVLHPVGYWSRTLNDAERNYSTTERECLAVVWAVLLLRAYLEGRKSVSYTHLTLPTIA